MESVSISRRVHVRGKGNKENTRPSHRNKDLISRDKPTPAPLHIKAAINNERTGKKDPVKVKTDVRPASSHPRRNPVGSNERGGASSHREPVTVSEKAAKLPTFNADAAFAAPKPPSSAAPRPPPMAAPGMYKGKVVQSKIGSIWKTNPTPTVKPANPRFASVPQSRSKSICETSHKPVATSFSSTRPPSRSFSANGCRKESDIPAKASGTRSSRPTTSAAEKVNKPQVSSAVSQYRVSISMETSEEKRAKLAAWLASKGKTMKRPAMTTAAPSRTKMAAKPKGRLAQTTEAPQTKEEQKDAVGGLHSANADAHCADSQEAEPTVQRPTPKTMDTSRVLLENSPAELLLDPQETVDDVVVNLCDALEAMATPSRCSDGVTAVQSQGEGVEPGSCKRQRAEGGEEEEVEAEVMIDEEEEESGEQEVETQVEFEEKTVEDASVIKYSVKTTPYLQSVRKTLESDSCFSSASKRKSNIKELKFLTPVRRSCRIQQKSSCLPSMLVDHDPCVSSLAELLHLEEDSNAFIYRKNAAILTDTPDHSSL